MKARILRALVFGLVLLGSTTLLADGSQIPWCPISCQSGPAVR